MCFSSSALRASFGVLCCLLFACGDSSPAKADAALAECEPGEYGASCAECDCGTGSCDDGASGTGACTCTAGTFGGDCSGACACSTGELCNDGTQGDGECYSVPLGAEAAGLTLGGHLAGRNVYRLGADINLPSCWVDSVNWTGNELVYGVASTDFTKLANGAGAEANPGCSLPTQHVGGLFDIYTAELGTTGWTVRHHDVNTSEHDAGASISGDRIAFTRYFADQPWAIFLAERVSEASWTTPVEFPHNSMCEEDNAHLYAGGTKIIFESTRLDSAGTACEVDREHKSLWYSEQGDSGAWSPPSLLPGAPDTGDKNTQPFVDEAGGFLYWTADTECGCVRRVRWENDAPVGDFENVVTPTYLGTLQDSDDDIVTFVGEYSEIGDYAFVACAIADNVGDGTNPELFRGRWQVNIGACALPAP